MASVDTPDDQLISVNYGNVETDDWAAKHQISLSELASRLDAKQHYDNRGRQIWTDGAEENTVQWNIAVLGGAAVARSLLCAWRGAASVEMALPMGLGGLAAINKHFYSPLTGRYGIEIAWSADHANIGTIDFHIVMGNAAGRYMGEISFEEASGQYSFTEWWGGRTALGQVPYLRADRHLWHKIKLVVDMDSSNFVRAMFDGQEHDLSMHTLQNLGPPAGSFLSVEVQCWGIAANAVNYYFDDFILTHLEP